MAYILGYARTPFGKRNGSLKDWRPDELAAFTVDALLARYGVPGEAVQDVVAGCVTQVNDQGANIARLTSLLSDRLPVETPGVSLNRMCGSGQQAANYAAMAVRSGEADLVVAGGVESMTRVGIGSDADVFSPKLHEEGWVLHQGEAAERICDRWKLTREDLDQFSLDSHRRAVAAQDRGFFKAETVPVPLEGGGSFELDEHPRRSTSIEALAKLQPAFRPDGRVTAGNSSGINDGAAFLLIGSKERARSLGVEPLARIVRTDAVGVDPTIMLTGPIPSTKRILEKADLQLRDIDWFEVNEAFASVPLAWMRETGVPPEKLNPNGGAIALGHPLGASGARLLMTAVNQLHTTGTDRALVTMCIGFGQGIATILECV